MTIEPHFHYEALEFFLNGKRFNPMIQEDLLSPVEKANAVIITLPAFIDHELNWEKQIELAREKKNLQIVWHVSFDYENKPFSPFDPLYFNAFNLALEAFNQTVYPQFTKRTLGVCLYKGDLNLFSRLKKCAQLQEHYEEFLSDYKADPSSFLNTLFGLNVFSDYVHRLASILPESVFPFCMLDATSYPSSLAAMLLCKRRFEHFLVAVKNKHFIRELNWQSGQINASYPISKPSIALALPSDFLMSAQILDELKKLSERLEQAHIVFRFIPEEYLNEEWHQLDEIIYLSSALTPKGLRMLQGFEAAGGSLICYGKPLGLEQEITLDTFIGRKIGAEGFEPPTHCSQSSCASQTALCSD